MEMSPPPPVVPRPYRRSTSDRIFGGVCGGLGRYWKVDPVILRVAFGVSLLFGGFGLFMYLALWLLVPDDLAPGDARIRDSWGLRILGALAAFVAAGIGLALLFGESNGGVLLGALLAGVVVWIVMSQRSTAHPAVEPAAPAVGYAYGGTGGYDTTMLPSPMPALRRERSYLGLIGLCAAVAAAGVAMLITTSPTAIMASALLALGLALAVGGFRGRARWLLIFAVPLLLLLAPASQLQHMDNPVGSQTWAPTESGSYSVAAGRLDVDLSQWRGTPAAGDRLDIEMGLGDVYINAPRNWKIRILNPQGNDINVVKPTGTTLYKDRGTVLVPAETATPDGELTIEVRMQLGSTWVTTDNPEVGTTPTPKKTAKTLQEKAA